MKPERKQETRRSRPVLLASAILMVLSSMGIGAQADDDEVSHWKGREVFRNKGCAECHSVFGRNGNGGPDLGKRKFYGTHLELAARMWNHFPKMYRKMEEADIEFQSIDSKEMEQLIAFLSFIRYRGEPGNAYKGQKLLRKRCMICHKFGGEGGDIGPEFDETSEYISSIQLVESMWNHGPDMVDIFEELQIERPVFKGKDINHILAAVQTYITTSKVPAGTFALGDPARGKILFTEKGCVHCHAFRGVGGTLGPDFADVELDYPAVQIAGKMWNHGPEMWEAMERENITFPAFRKGEMAHVLAYLYSLKVQDDPGNAGRGRRIVHDKGCLDCHSLQGKGATTSTDLAELDGLDSPMAMIAAMWNHAPGMQEKHLEKRLKWPKLDKRDMADLYAYLHEKSHQPGRTQ